MSNDYLIHYGVLGMKWGIRKSREVKDVKLAYKGLKKDKDTKEAYKKELRNAKYSAAIRLGKRHSVSDLASKDIADLSAGRAFGQSLLLGSYGARKYNEYMTAGDDKKNAFTKAWVADWANKSTFGAYGYASDKMNANPDLKKRVSDAAKYRANNALDRIGGKKSK